MNIDFTDPEAVLDDKNEKVEELKRILRKLKHNREKKSLLNVDLYNITHFLRRKKKY